MNDKTTSSKSQQNTAQEKTAVKSQGTPQKPQSQAGSVKAGSVAKKPPEQQKAVNVKITSAPNDKTTAAKKTAAEVKTASASKEATLQQKTAANDKTATVRKTTAEVKNAPVSKETAPQAKSKIKNRGSVKMSQNQEENKTAKKKDADTYDEQKDIQTNKGMAALAYLLFFLPLVTEPAKTSKFARFHANQGLVYLIFYAAIIIVTRVLSVILWSALWSSGWGVWYALDIIFWLVFVAYTALGVCWALIIAYKGNRKKIPLIGKITIIKEEAKTAN